MGGGMMMGMGAKPKNFKKSMKQLISYLSPYWMAMIGVVFLAIASTAFGIVSPKILGNITNDIVTSYIQTNAYNDFMKSLPKGVTFTPGTTGADVLAHLPAAYIKKIPSNEQGIIESLSLTHKPTYDFHSIGMTILILIMLYLLSSIGGYAQSWVMTNITQKVTYKFRKDISDKINRMPLKYFDKVPFGDTLSRVTNDVDTLSQTLNQSLIQVLTSVIMIIGIVIMMLTISWQLTIVAIVMLPISFGLIGFIIKKSQGYFKGLQDSLGGMNGHIEEMYAGHKLVKVFNGEQRSLDTFNDINHNLYENAWKSQFFSGLMLPIMTFIGNLGYVAVAVYGGWLAINRVVNIGGIQAFIQYVSQFNQPIAQVANIANILQSAAAAAERVFEFLAEEEEVPDKPDALRLDEVKGAVSFDHVNFGYAPDKQIIHDLSMDIQPGSRIAIVGPTGAGKTTIVNLLMRFYDVSEGAIRVDGIDIRTMRRSDLRTSFGMVLQDTWLFNGTVSENIEYGKLGASEEEVVAAAKEAYVDHFVRTLPKGYHNEINEDADDISQGEKQLLTIARAMLANAPILILDEATSSVDTRTELLIQQAMDRLMQGRTSFVIAHRLSTIQDADLILVMNHGEIVERGTHDSLLAQNGFYATLYNSQFAED